MKNVELRLNVELNIKERLMNKSQFFENKTYWVIDIHSLYNISKKYRLDYSSILDYVHNFPHKYINFMLSIYFEQREDAQKYVDYVEALVCMEELIK